MRRKAKEKESKEGSLLDFIGPKVSEEGRESVPSREVTEVSRKVEPPAVEAQVLEKISQYLCTKGEVTKTSLYRWSKQEGIKPVDLYRTLVLLEKEGRLKKAFDADRGEIVYQYLA
ncbi:MAG: hypothetical protein DRJ51_03735 [Thermoprotei archaeon]|nr:MAG: hypothetical protein DRJ51_03735 [Thermoprotei archaeon]RLF01948.1 MAG: hypothetical protein DRJ59_04910 [Thermoprotei archaeon]